MTEPLLRDLIDIPEAVHKSDFVISIEGGVDDAEKTLRTYVVTDQLRGCFDSALSLITSGVDERASKGAYLHGSFGSGKSHFMAVLHLLLQGDTRARAISELSPVIAKYGDKLDGRRYLVVPYHMIGKHSMEDGVLGGYVDHVRELHPEAPIPGVYVADSLLDDARRLREQMGDERFFANLAGGAGADDGFGDLAAGWDAGSFDAAAVAPPKSEDRERLVSDLIDAYYSSTHVSREASGQGYVPFDDGLAAISRHAKQLGYDGVVFFLDELILWFATRMADPQFVRTEGPKVAKLVEAPKDDRPVPIVSFIARQRDLREFVGKGMPGAEKLNFGQTLEYWEGRFDTIELEDRNLAAIVEKRLLAPSTEAGRQQIDAAFEQTAAKAGRAMDTLLTTDADRAAFRRVYPFSPALIDSLVAVSGYLQRERTALRLLMQLLVDQRDTLKVGDLVPLGDLYDVIKTGDEPFSEELKRHFLKAKRLYETRLRPLLLAEHGLEDGQADGLPPSHPFRTDDRLAKTLLLAALVPDAKAMRELTVRRLADLNHGTIRTPIPGQERAAVLSRIRKWSAEIGELRVEGDEQDPTVSLRLTGVDTEAIIDRASAVDNTGARRQKVRSLVADALGLKLAGGALPDPYSLVWRGSRRQVDVRFANVRDATDIPDSQFRAGDDPLVVIDFPFDDDPVYGPAEDHARVANLIDQLGATSTVCWLPRFLTERALDRLGRLVVIDHLLSGDTFERNTTDLAPADRIEARHSLENQAEALRMQLRDVLRQAYGVEQADEQWIRSDLSAPQQFASLDPTLRIRPPVATGLQEAFEQIADAVFTHTYPAHPYFDDEVRIGDLRVCLDYVRKAVGTRDGRVDVASPDRKAIRKVLGPLKLATTGEAHLTLGREWLDHFHVKAKEHGVQTVTVEHLKRWINEPQPMGLDDRVANLVVSTYALQDDRVLLHAGQPIPPAVERLDPTVEARTQRPPDEVDWKAAQERAQRIFGIPASPLPTASNVAALASALQESARTYRDAVRQLREALPTATGFADLEPNVDRVRTAQAAVAMLDAVLGSEDVEAVEAFARAEVPTTADALGRSIKSAEEVAAAIRAANWQLLATATGLGGKWASQAEGIAERLRSAIAADELVESLPQALRAANDAATDLMTKTVEKPPVDPEDKKDEKDEEEQERTQRPGRQTFTFRAADGDRDAARARLNELLSQVDELSYLDVQWDTHS